NCSPELSSTTAFPYPPMKPNSNGSPPDQPMPHASHTPDLTLAQQLPVSADHKKRLIDWIRACSGSSES
ncbi:MAG: hypothetical protein J0M01_16050, partial [Dechloromonas sp.]|nr:hypothetical protein [Dechloromonas sp.]